MIGAAAGIHTRRGLPIFKSAKTESDSKILVDGEPCPKVGAVCSGLALWLLEVSSLGRAALPWSYASLPRALPTSVQRWDVLSTCLKCSLKVLAAVDGFSKDAETGLQSTWVNP